MQDNQPLLRQPVKKEDAYTKKQALKLVGIPAGLVQSQTRWSLKALCGLMSGKSTEVCPEHLRLTPEGDYRWQSADGQTEGPAPRLSPGARATRERGTRGRDVPSRRHGVASVGGGTDGWGARTWVHGECMCSA